MEPIKSKQDCPFSPETISVAEGGRALCALCAVTREQADERAVMDDTSCVPQDELRRLTAQVLSIQESERQRIARDLHDGLGQSLTLIRLGLEECAALLSANAHSEAEESLQRLKLQVRNALCEVRRVAMDLRPSTLDDLGILATMTWFFREFEGTCHGIHIEKQLLVQESDIPVSLKITIFRMLQEAISNTVKHAKADHIRVSLMKADGALHFSIEDNGQGFDQTVRDDYCPHGRGFGLVSMKERAIHSGGTYRIDSKIGQGTRIHVSWPCG